MRPERGRGDLSGQGVEGRGSGEPDGIGGVLAADSDPIHDTNHNRSVHAFECRVSFQRPVHDLLLPPLRRRKPAGWRLGSVAVVAPELKAPRPLKFGVNFPSVHRGREG